MKFSKTMVALIVLMNVVYTMACLYVFLKTGAEPTVLTAAWFGFTTGELWLIATIKKNKLKRGVQNGTQNVQEANDPKEQWEKA